MPDGGEQVDAALVDIVGHARVHRVEVADRAVGDAANSTRGGPGGCARDPLGQDVRGGRSRQPNIAHARRYFASLLVLASGPVTLSSFPAMAALVLELRSFIEGHISIDRASLNDVPRFASIVVYTHIDRA